MKNYLKLVVAVFVFTITAIVSMNSTYAAKRPTGTGGCDSSDAECGTDLKGNQICGAFIGKC